MDKERNTDRGLWRSNGQTERTMEKHWIIMEDYMEKQRTHIEDSGATIDKHTGPWRNNGET